jgi:hypothetical protein
MNPLEKNAATVAPNQFPSTRFTAHPHRHELGAVLFDDANVFPAQVLCFGPMTHARIGEEQHIIAQQQTHFR